MKLKMKDFYNNTPVGVYNPIKSDIIWIIDEYLKNNAKKNSMLWFSNTLMRIWSCFLR